MVNTSISFLNLRLIYISIICFGKYLVFNDEIRRVAEEHKIKHMSKNRDDA